MVDNVDIVCDLSWGDTGKGKVSAHLAKTGAYDFVARWAGGNNAGHTVFVDGKKLKTHIIPSGVFYGVKSVIGPGCVINEKSFYDEMKYLNENGFDTSLVKISPRAHVVTRDHIETDSKGLSHLGTTKRGIAPCYSDKMMRSGIQAKSIFPRDLLFDSENMYGNILCEGAQGFYLDIDWGNYPYVTSSNTLPYAACSLGFSPKKIRDIWGLCKAYDTRAGKDPYFENKVIERRELSGLANLGSEFGVTTGRKRSVNWMNLDLLIKAINITGTNVLVVNKCDILREFGKYNLIYMDLLVSLSCMDDMQDYIKEKIFKETSVEVITFSDDPEKL
jgi:adenylosuccinate synthase